MKRLLFIMVSIVVLVGGVAAIALPTILHKAGMHPVYDGVLVDLGPGKRALIITTSHGVLSEPGTTLGPPSGVMASEFTHPYYNFIDAGIEVDLASIKGGEIPIDPQTLSYAVRTPEDDRFLEDAVLNAKVADSIRIDGIDFSQYDIVFLSGGWGAAYDLGQSAVLGEKISDAYYSEREPLIGGVCHGVLGLINAQDRNGELLISGRRMTGVTDKQIEELGIEATPLHPEIELRKAGVRYESQTAFRDIFATHVVIDDEQRFVTGQNQNSGREASHAMMALLAQREHQ